MRFHTMLTFLILAMGLWFVLPAYPQQQQPQPQRPLTQDQVQSLVRDGLGDKTGAKAIEQRGIDFTPSEDFYQSLKAAGASEAFLKALRAADRGRETRLDSGPPPSEPDRRISRIRLSSRWFYLEEE